MHFKRATPQQLVEFIATKNYRNKDGYLTDSVLFRQLIAAIDEKEEHKQPPNVQVRLFFSNDFDKDLETKIRTALINALRGNTEGLNIEAELS